MSFQVFSHLNWLAILVAGVGYFVLGAIWYSKILFAKPWMKMSGVNPNDPNAKKGMVQTMFASLLLMIVASIGIALFLSRVGVSSWMSGAKTGLVAGVCFSSTAVMISYLYEKRPLGLHLINAGYNTLGCVVAGTILAVWK